MRFSRILCAVNTDPLADTVFDVAYGLSQTLKAEIALVCILDESLIQPGESGYTMSDMRAEYRRDINQLMDRLLSEKKAPLIPRFSDEGDPKKLILAAAEDWKADMIVIASHARTGLNRILMGSVAEQILRHSHCPVLIVPAHKQ